MKIRKYFEWSNPNITHHDIKQFIVRNLQPRMTKLSLSWEGNVNCLINRLKEENNTMILTEADKAFVIPKEPFGILKKNLIK